jgi:transposase
MNDVDPHAWLTQTPERIAQGWPISQIDQLMPWNFKPERPQLGAYGETALN